MLHGDFGPAKPCIISLTLCKLAWLRKKLMYLAMWCGIMIGIAGGGLEVKLMIEVEFPSVACFDGPTREV